MPAPGGRCKWRLHMIHLPQGQRDSRGEEVSETRGQTAQLETYPVAIELDGAVEVLDQQTYSR